MPATWICPVCASTTSRPRWPVPAQGTEGGVDAVSFRPSSDRFGELVATVRTCDVCGHGAVDALPDDAAVQAAYEDAVDEVALREEPGQLRTADLLLEEVEAFVPPGRLLDVGCFTGSLAVAANRRGWAAEGVEPSRWAAGRATERGVQVVATALETVPAGAGPYRAVALLDVLEHLSDPAGAVRRCAGLLEEGGLVVVTVPDAGSRLARLLGRRWWSVLPMHLQYFTERSLSRLVENAGLSVVHSGTHPKVFSQRYYAERLQAAVPLVGPLVLALAGSGGRSRRLRAPDFRDRRLLFARKESVRVSANR